MALPPIDVQLSEGQKTEVLKRFQTRYGDELKKVEADLQDILVQLREADHVASFLGEQPEVAQLRQRQDEVAALEKRRQHLGKILERLEQVILKPPPLAVAPPSGAAAVGKPASLKRF